MATRLTLKRIRNINHLAVREGMRLIPEISGEALDTVRWTRAKGGLSTIATLVLMAVCITLPGVAAAQQPSPTIVSIETLGGDALFWLGSLSPAMPATIGEDIVFTASSNLPVQDYEVEYHWSTGAGPIASTFSPTYTMPGYTLAEGGHTVSLEVTSHFFPGGSTVSTPAYYLWLLPEQPYCTRTLPEWRALATPRIWIGSFIELPASSIDKLILGTSGDDDLSGAVPIQAVDGHDCIYGFQGNDVLKGGPGPDEIHGGDGADTVIGDTGDDLLYGGRGNDNIVSDTGDDIVWAGEGDDTVIGDTGNDVIYGCEGNDNLQGDAGNDTLFGGAGVDVIHGRSSADLIYAGSGDDVDVLGDSGGDLLCGQQGNDSLDGESDNDIVDGGAGSDFCRGGGGGSDLCLMCATLGSGCESTVGSSGCPVCGNGFVEAGEQCDPPASGACTSECLFEDTLFLSGVSTAGGSTNVTINGVTVHVEYPPGSPSEIAQAVVDAINANQSVGDLCVSASLSGAAVVLERSEFSVVDIDDPDVYPCQDDDLLVHYRFDNSSDPGVDDSGSGNHGVVTGAEIVAGVRGNALSLEGGDGVSEFEGPASTALNLAGDMTAIAWIRPAGSHSGPSNCEQGTILTKGGNYWFQVEPDNDGLLIQHEYSGVEAVSVPASIPIGLWTQVAFVRRAQQTAPYEVDVYMNGNLIGQGILNQEPATVGNVDNLIVGFGSVAAPNACEFNGRIDEIKIYQCALGPTQIRTEQRLIRILPMLSIWGFAGLAVLLTVAATRKLSSSRGPMRNSRD